MALPIEPVTLTVAQISDLAEKLSGFRHDMNNKLSIIAGSVELIRHRPEKAERLLNSLGEQPKKISEMIAQFSTEFEAALNIKRS